MSPDYGLRRSGAPVPGLVDYVNVPGYIGTLIATRLATLNELDSVYGLEDAYNLLEILTVDRYNERVINDYRNR